METKSTPSGTAYPPPLDRLLGLGSLFTRGDWRDYRQMGLGHEHVPDLLRMACDPKLNFADQDDPRVYAPLHAWRALGQLAPPDAAAPLAELLVRLPDDDFANEELPVVLGMIGAPSVDPAAAVLADAALEERTRISAACALEEAGKRHPELRDRCVQALMRQLERWAELPEGLNGFLIHDLIELEAVEGAPLMQAAFEAERVDISIRGDWEDVQIDLGLLENRLTVRKPVSWLARMGVLARRPVEQPPVSSGKAPGKRRGESKEQAQGGKGGPQAQPAKIVRPPRASGPRASLARLGPALEAADSNPRPP